MDTSSKLSLQKHLVALTVFLVTLFSLYFIFAHPLTAFSLERCIRFIGSIFTNIRLLVILSSLVGFLFIIYQIAKTKRFIQSLPIISLLTMRPSFRRLIHDLQLENSLLVVQSSDLLCFCAGIVNPKIYLGILTINKLNINELKAVLTHEKHHLNNKSHLKMITLRLLSSMFFYIPILKELSDHYMLLDEIQADNDVIKQPSDRLHLAKAFYKFAALPKRGTQYLTTTFIENTPDAIEIRINRLSDTSLKPQLRFSISTLIMTAIFFAAILVTVYSSKPLYAHTQKEEKTNCHKTKNNIWYNYSLSLDK